MSLKKTLRTKLNQAKKRDKKVKITDIAIEKIPLIQYKGLSEQENEFVHILAKTVLKLSKEQNESNEVAITYDLSGEQPYGISFGNEHSVDVCSDTRSFHILLSAERATVVMLHNHPSTKTFSLEDLRFLLTYDSIKLLIVISNQGTIHYISKQENYNRDDAIALYTECLNDLYTKCSVREIYHASMKYLSNCSRAGLYYN